jgi:excisionase family DNA binding protein
MEKRRRAYRLLSRLLNSKTLFTTGEIAKLLDVNINTVVLWAETGQLGGFKLPGDTARRIERDKLIDFIMLRDLPLAVEPEALIEVVLVGADPVLEHRFQTAVDSAFGYKLAKASCAFEAGAACAEIIPDMVLVHEDSTDFDPHVFATCRRHWKHLSYTVLAAMSNSQRKRDAFLTQGYDAVFPVPSSEKEILDLVDRIAESA